MKKRQVDKTGIRVWRKIKEDKRFRGSYEKERRVA